MAEYRNLDHRTRQGSAADEAAAHPDGGGLPKQDLLEAVRGHYASQRLEANTRPASLHGDRRHRDIQRSGLSKLVGNRREILGTHVINVGDKLDEILDGRVCGNRVSENDAQRIRAPAKILGAGSVAAADW